MRRVALGRAAGVLVCGLALGVAGVSQGGGPPQGGSPGSGGGRPSRPGGSTRPSPGPGGSGGRPQRPSPGSGGQPSRPGPQPSRPGGPGSGGGRPPQPGGGGRPQPGGPGSGGGRPQPGRPGVWWTAAAGSAGRQAAAVGTAAAEPARVPVSAERPECAAAALPLAPAVYQPGAATDLQHWRLLSVWRYRLSHAAAAIAVRAVAAAAVWLPDGVLRRVCRGV